MSQGGEASSPVTEVDDKKGVDGVIHLKSALRELNLLSGPPGDCWSLFEICLESYCM